MNNEKYDQVNDETIKLLVDGFYEKVRRHEKLGAIFESMIGTSEEDWRPHLERMYQFWSSIILSTGRYHGNPMQKHMDIPQFEPELFDQWLELFEETAKELHTESIATNYIDKSKRVAESLKLALYYRPERKTP